MGHFSNSDKSINPNSIILREVQHPLKKCMAFQISAFTSVPIREDLRKNRERGDVILDADGKKFPAHAVILASQSAVLASAIERQWEQIRNSERKNRSREPPKCEVYTKLAAQTLRILLNLIYHEQVTAPLESIFDVLLAADKYRILHIVDCTAQTLVENITLPVAVSVLNVYHGTTDPNLTDLVCHALDCLTDPLNFYDLTDEQKPGNPLNKHLQMLSYDAVKMVAERQVMAENKAEFVHATCKLINCWGIPIPSKDRVLMITELLKIMDVQALSAQQMANIIRLEVFMDNHQTQGFLMKTITKLLVQLEVTKLQSHFKTENAQINAQLYQARLNDFRAQSVPGHLDNDFDFPPVPKTRSSNTIDRRRHEDEYSESQASRVSQSRSHRSKRSKKTKHMEHSEQYVIALNSSRGSNI